MGWPDPTQDGRVALWPIRQPAKQNIYMPANCRPMPTTAAYSSCYVCTCNTGNITSRSINFGRYNYSSPHRFIPEDKLLLLYVYALWTHIINCIFKNINQVLASIVHSVHINLTHLIFSDYFRADVSCSKLPLRWLDIRAKCDSVGGLEISTQSFLDDDLSSIKHLRIQLLCRGGEERSVQRGH